MGTEAGAVVREVFAAVAARDGAALERLLDDTAELHTPGTARRAGRDGPYRGASGVQQYLADLDELWARFVLEPQELRVANHGVVAFGRVAGELRDGTPVAQPVIWVFKLRDGRVRSVRVAETAAEAQALAARAPAPASPPPDAAG